MSTPEKQATRRAVAILLAAGAGRRFDPTGQRNKLLAKIDDQPVAVLAAKNLLDAGLPVVAVVRDAVNSPMNALEQADCVVTVCESADLGMGHSLAHAIRFVREQFDPDIALIALGDMPFLDASVIQSVFEAVNQDQTIVAAAAQGRRGHPVAFWRSHFDELTQLTGDNGAGALLTRYPVSLVDSGDNSAIRDIDEEKDLPD